MQNIYETFEFNKIRQAIAEFAKSELSKEYISSLEMFSSSELVNTALAELNEMISINLRFGNLPISNSANAIKLINLAKKTNLLTCRDLSLIAEDVITINKIINFMKSVDVSYPLIKSITAKFIDLDTLEKEIHRVINSSLTINDNATPELKEIRRNIKKAEAELQSKVASITYSYSSILNDSNATIRDGHFVLPVKTVDKNKISGAVYGVSDSGSTTFIEPLEIISINNKITSLKVEENEECRKILKQLTSLVLLQENEILTNNRLISELDFLQAKSLYATSINAIVAESSDKQEISVQQARHPLIDPIKVVSNSYYLNEEKRIVIISGPNAGGKTVSLKAVGLLVLMNQCGLAIPVQKGKLGFFKHIYIDIGDSQSLSDNLSTFSAHMSHIADIIALAKGKDLVLIDELGTGTDPKEGEAIAVSVTKHLVCSHSLAMISSHFGALKELAFINNNVENSCMIFDEENLVPTYIFKMGAPGKSYGLYVAKRYGIKDDIIKESNEFLSQNENANTDKLLTVLQEKIEHTTKLENELTKEKDRLNRLAKQLEVDRINLQEKRDHLLESVNKEKENMIEDAKEQIDSIIKILGSGDLKLHDVIALKKRIEDLEVSEENEEFNEEIKEGDFVEIPALSLCGKVIRLNGSKAKVNTDSGMTLNVEMCRLHKTEKKKENTSVNRSSRGVELNLKSVPIELNIIGMHVDEAKEVVLSYLDDCEVKHMSKVRIIHGFGSGALRKMVHSVLDKKKNLTYRLGDMYEGGGGATVITFNDRENKGVNK